jgi:hypothetical protein
LKPVLLLPEPDELLEEELYQANESEEPEPVLEREPELETEL